MGGIIALYHDGSPEHDHAHVPKPAHTRVPNQNTTIHVYPEGSQKDVAAAQEFLAGWPQHSRLHGSVDQPWGREVKVDGSRPIVRRKSGGGSE